MRLPVIIIFKDKKQLIRGLPSKILAWYMFQLMKSQRFAISFVEYNAPDTIKALAVEALTRSDITGKARAYAINFASPNCKCGKAGLYIVAHTTYCSDCKPNAVKRRAKNVEMLDKGQLEIHKAVEEQKSRTDGSHQTKRGWKKQYSHQLA